MAEVVVPVAPEAAMDTPVDRRRDGHDLPETPGQHGDAFPWQRKKKKASYAQNSARYQQARLPKAPRPQPAVFVQEESTFASLQYF